MNESSKPRASGINHVALEVGNIEEALSFYGRILEFELRSQSEEMAFIDLGDQFIALSRGREQPADESRHFGLVVDDKEAVRQLLNNQGIEIVSDRFLDFYDPWGNRIQVVGYDEIEFTKSDAVLNEMGIDDELVKT